MKVEITFRAGPFAGRRAELEVGSTPVEIGREPGRGGLHLPGEDSSISRRHAELRESDGQLLLTNLSQNGTLVNGRIVRDSVAVEPSAVLQFGRETALELAFRSSVPEARQRTAPRPEVAPSALQQGILAKPAVRLLLAVYLLGIVLVAAYVGFSADSSESENWVRAKEEYSQFMAESMGAEERQARLDRADRLIRELQAYERTGRWDEARMVCFELMALDSSPDSPIYRFGAQRLGTINQ